MKTVLRFTLPAEVDEFRQAIRGPTYLAVLLQVATWLRGRTKYAEMKPADWRIYEEVSIEFWKICEEYRVDPFGEEGPL
jgi:hypothetical protein